jgi:hypothetical protein
MCGTLASNVFLHHKTLFTIKIGYYKSNGSWNGDEILVLGWWKSAKRKKLNLTYGKGRICYKRTFINIALMRRRLNLVKLTHQQRSTYMIRGIRFPRTFCFDILPTSLQFLQENVQCLTFVQEGLLSVFCQFVTVFTDIPVCRINTAVVRRVPGAVGELLHLKLKLNYDRQSVGQSVLGSGTHLGPATIFSVFNNFLGSYGFVDVGRPLWREVGSVVFSCCWA